MKKSEELDQNRSFLNITVGRVFPYSFFHIYCGDLCRAVRWAGDRASDMQAWKAAQTEATRQQYLKSKAHQRHLAVLKKLEDQRKQREKTRRARKAAGDRKRADKAKKIAAKIAMKAMKAMGAA